MNQEKYRHIGHQKIFFFLCYQKCTGLVGVLVAMGEKKSWEEALYKSQEKVDAMVHLAKSGGAPYIVEFYCQTRGYPILT